MFDFHLQEKLNHEHIIRLKCKNNRLLGHLHFQRDTLHNISFLEHKDSYKKIKYSTPSGK